MNPGLPYAVRLPNMGKHLYPLALRPGGTKEVEALLSAPAPADRRAQLYIHFPFCQNICTFCLIQKYRLGSSSPVAEYVNALKKELLAYSRSHYVESLKFNSIYFGGGTPSVIENRYLAEVFELVTSAFHLENAQITFEGNFQSLTREKIRFARALGFTRLSAGVQTFDRGLRKALNLIPTIDDMRRSLDDARSAGFDDFNLDLMFNLPGQTLEIWERDLRLAAGLEPSGIDAFETVIAKNTPLYNQVRNGDLACVRDPLTQTQSYRMAEDILAAAGYDQRNLYVWTRRGFANALMDCQDELRDQTLDIVGAGLSSYSFINGAALFNEPLASAYIERVHAGGFSAVAHFRPTREQMMARFMIMSLQTFVLDRNLFGRTFDASMDAIFEKALGSFKRRGLISPDSAGFRLTPLGRAWASTMAVEFYDTAYLQDTMRARLENRIAPGLTLEEEYDHIAFTVFHPEIVIKNRLDPGLLVRYLGRLRRTEPGWAGQLFRTLYERWLTYRRFPLRAYLATCWMLLGGRRIREQ
jgi:oxygen-independent coproporphyrinogen III oxidase